MLKLLKILREDFGQAVVFHNGNHVTTVRSRGIFQDLAGENTCELKGTIYCVNRNLEQ